MELWPGGDQRQARPLGCMEITNDGTGSRYKGNYDVERKGRGGEVFQRGKVVGFLRTERSVWHLVRKALKTVYRPNQTRGKTVRNMRSANRRRRRRAEGVA